MDRTIKPISAMRHIVTVPRLAVTACLAVSYMAFAPMAFAQLQPMTDSEMSTARGQGLLELHNSSSGGFDFSRISFGADINLNANFRNMRWGEYNYLARNASGADIDMPALQFGRSDGTDAQRLVQITNPYFEVIYRNSGNAATREIVGMRFGFDSIAGDIGLKLAALSGSMRIDGGAAGVLDSRTDPGGGKRWDGACSGACLNFSQIGAIRAGDAAGPSRDFWMAVLKTPVQFAPTHPSLPVPDMAQAGFWMNWRDKLTALNSTGALPANLPLAR